MAAFTLKEIKKLEKKATPIEKYVFDYIIDEWESDLGDEPDSDHTYIATQVLEYGCQSGIVGSLIYYNDTTAFYNKYKDEINKLVHDNLTEEGLSLSDLNGWDEEDPLALQEGNQATLAWFGFEETLRNICRKYFEDTFKDYI